MTLAWFQVAARGVSRISHHGERLPPWLRQLMTGAGWLVVVWILVFWRLGYPSFWDPGDEAQYAQASREMLRGGHWLVPTYNGRLFADKPVLFFFLQMLSYPGFGVNEFAPRFLPARSVLGPPSGVGW